MQQLLKLVEESGYVYWSRKKDESEVVRDIFWAHPESVKLLNMFPIVLIMDCTYKTNKYRQPLFEIIGMTSTKLTFVVTFSYMESEQTETFCWVLDKLKQLFIKRDFGPQVYLTDRDLALMKAIETVFPKTTNLLCRFHINKNVKSKCKEHVVDDMRESVEKMWYELIRASDEMEYRERLKQLEDACVDSKAFIDYVNDTWLKSSLVIDSLGQQPPEKWMMLPDFGYVISNRYNVVLISLGNPSLSYFPMTSAYSPNASIYCIGFVNENHWVQVNMNEGFPLPPVTTDWKKYRTKDATSWMIGFVGWLQHWQQLTPILPKYVRL